MEEANKLDVEVVLAEDSRYDRLEKVVVDELGRYTEIHCKFRPTRIDEMFEDYARFLDEYEREAGTIREKELFSYLYLHIVLYFSTLADPMPVSFPQKVKLLQALLDSGWLEKVFDALPVEEVTKVFHRMSTILERFGKLQAASRDTENRTLEEVR